MACILNPMNVPFDLMIPTGVGPIDLGRVAKIAEQTGSVSSPLLAKTIHIELPQAESALAELAELNYLELLPESGLVRTYRFTRNAYEAIEAGRSRRSILGRLFQTQEAV